MTKEKSLTVQAEKAPSFITKGEFDSESIEISPEDIKMSQLKLLQSYKEDQGKPGEFIDTGSLANYGNSVEIIVLKHQKEWLIFNDSFKLEKRSNDGAYWDDRTPISQEEKWQNASHKYYILVANDLQPFPMYLSFMNTSFKAGGELLNYVARFSKGNNEPVYARTYILSSENIDGKKGNYYVSKIRPKGYLESEKMFQAVKQVSDNIKNITVTEQYESPEDKSEPEFDNSTPAMD